MSRSVWMVSIAVAACTAGCIEEGAEDSDDGADYASGDGKADGGAPYILIGAHDTYLKKLIRDSSGAEVQASELEVGTEKCALPAGTRLEVQGPGSVDGGHVRITTRTRISGCSFDLGYVYIPHVVRASFPLRGVCAATISASACALLGTIAFAEGTAERYDITFGYRTFTSYADHPRLLVCSGGYCSDAAGRYQILSTTWDGIRSGLPDFAPASQDLAALRLVRNRGVADVDGIDTYAEFTSAIGRLNLEWASLPGSPYGQPTRTMSSLWNEFRNLRGIQ